MKHLKKVVAVGAMVLVFGATSITVFAASTYNSPAEAVAGLTGKTVESIVDQKAETGETYGAIAKDAGKLTEFQTEMLEIKKDRLDARVAAGTLTQAEADEILAKIKENQATCDGTGSGRVGKRMGGGFGGMNGGQGKGQGGCGGSCQAE